LNATILILDGNKIRWEAKENKRLKIYADSLDHFWENLVVVVNFWH
jgi:hypothetical protein